MLLNYFEKLEDSKHPSNSNYIFKLCYFPPDSIGTIDICFTHTEKLAKEIKKAINDGDKDFLEPYFLSVAVELVGNKDIFINCVPILNQVKSRLDTKTEGWIESYDPINGTKVIPEYIYNQIYKGDFKNE